MRHLFAIFAIIVICLASTACPKSEPEGLIKGMIEDFRQINWPIYYWETVEGKTAVYRILESTRDINTILYGLEGVRDLKSSYTSVYILHDDRDGYLAVTRLENDRTQTTEAIPELKIKSEGWITWAVSGNDNVVITGVDDDGEYHVIGLEFTRRERERTFRRDEDLTPIVEFEETEWYSSTENIGAINISPDAGRIAVTQPLNDGSGYYGLYFIDGPSGQPVRIGDNGVMELGGFSPDNNWFLATFEQPGRVDAFLIDNESLEPQAVTRLASGYRAGHPVWQKNSQYFIYTTDFTTEFQADATTLSGEQLYLYSLVSMNERRLTAFTGVTLWIDISPVGDFFLYSSTPGVVSRMGRGLPDEVSQEAIERGLETWRLYYVPWDPEQFQTGNLRILTPDESRFLVSWTAGGQEVIGFMWAPGAPNMQ